MSPIIAVTNLSYAYPSVTPNEAHAWVLREINIGIEAGEFVAVMGANSSGKTTLCLSLNGIVPQSTGGTIKGQVLVDGLDTKRTPLPELARRVGMVLQDPETQFFNMSVETEIAFGLETLGVVRAEMRERITWALDLVGLRGFEKRSPFQLSGGQKQRVAIAAVIAMLPKILVLDAPTASLDPLGKTEFFNVVRTLRQSQNMTIVMAEQDSERVAEFADRVIVLREGQVEWADTPERVLSHVERMRAAHVSVPQVSELAACLNSRLDTRFHFIRFDQALKTLEQETSTARERSGIA